MPNSPVYPELNRTHAIATLLTTDVEELLGGAQERLEAPVPGFDGASKLRSRYPADKWLLSSATQKLIRRGLAEQAVKTALALHALDPDYLPRRLPIIAFEDISIGGLETCFDTLHVFGTQRFTADIPEPERRQVLANLVYRLARSVKSRTGCDIFCSAHADPNVSTAAAKFAKSSEQCLIALASDRGAEVTSRALALHLLTGMSVLEGRWHRTLSRFNAGGLKAVAENLDLSPIVTWMLTAGRNTAGLAAMLPLAMETVAGATDLQTGHIRGGEAKVLAEKPIIGLPACTADQYTRIGKAAIAEFTKAVREKHPSFFDNAPDTRNHSKLIAMAIFHAEGSKLDRWIECKAVADYRERIEQVELWDLGLADPGARQQLYRILETEGELLWKIRKAHFRAAYGKGRADK